MTGVTAGGRADGRTGVIASGHSPRGDLAGHPRDSFGRKALAMTTAVPPYPLVPLRTSISRRFVPELYWMKCKETITVRPSARPPVRCDTLRC